MAYGIARIAKLNAGNINSSAIHARRERTTLNANPEIENIRLIGKGDRQRLSDTVRQRIGEQTIRKNAVLCVEMLLTASPEYFRPNEPEKAGYYEPQKLEDWQQAVRKWLDDNYGDRIVRAELHLDESTPHIHAYLVPLDERGKLNCRGLFGGRQKLSAFQDSYAAAMLPLGLERGIKGSKAKHTKIKQYYAAVNSSPDLALDDQTIQQQLADRQKAIAEKEQLTRTAKSLSRENKKLLTRLRQASNKIAKQSKEIETWQDKYRDTVGKVRELPLDEVVYELGLRSDPKDKHKWRDGQHIISITGSKFYDWKQMNGGGGAIDLVMHVNECDFKQAIAWLGDRFGEVATLDAVSYKVREIIQTEPVAEFVPPAADGSKWQAVRKYLTGKRKLPSGLVDSLHESGLIYADRKQNAVFLRRSMNEEKVTGANLRGTAGEENKFKGLAKGTRRNRGWFYFQQGGQAGDPIDRVVLVESPIDALSLAVLDRNESRRTIYLSTDGAGDIPLEFLKEIEEVIVAYDNDEAGNLMAQRVKSELPDAVRKLPQAVDWNEDLVNSFDWSPTPQNRARERGLKR